MRRYWQPAALIDELSGNRPVKPVRLLGEDLVAFKDDQGRYGLIGRHCPHRGTDLAYGRLGRRRAALRLSRLAVRRQRPMPANAGRARRQQSLRQYQTEVLSGGGEEWHPVRLSWARRAAGISAFRLLRRAVDAHLRVQRHDRLQLAAIARSRHRSGAYLVPASLLRGRRPEPGLRQDVPRHLEGLGHADDQDHARIYAPAHRGRADRLRLPAGRRCARSATTRRMCASPI